MTRHDRVLTSTRVVIAGLLLIALWAAPGMLSTVCASIGTLLWLFMANVVKFEEKLIDIIRRKK